MWPPAIRPGRTAGEEVLEALHLVRSCFMPQAGMGREVELWVTENGYATDLGKTEERQLENLVSTVEALHEYSGTLNVTDYRWFNLRDNDSDGSDLFSAVGLLRDDYSEKPAYPAFRELLARYGTDADPPAPPPARGPGPPVGAGPPADDRSGLPATGGGIAAAGMLAVVGAVGRRRRR